MNQSRLPLSHVKVGLVGTGFVAKLRAETLQALPDASLVAVVGHTPEKARAFAQQFQTEWVSSWVDLVHRPDIDLIVISNINQAHGAIAYAALNAGKHVVVEYPLSLDVDEAAKIVALARSRQLLLHVEHLELLGGVHATFKAFLPEIGTIGFARYATVTPQRPVGDRWTYQPELFGFPLMGALSRLHRLIDAFGTVDRVSGYSQTWHQPGRSGYHSSLCSAQLQFTQGMMAEVTYAKGENFWQSERRLVVEGSEGALIFDGDTGELANATGRHPLTVGARRGLFVKDTTMVIAHLTAHQPLYVTPEASLYSLRVADAIRQAVATQQVMKVAA